MKAIQMEEIGGPEVMRLVDIPVPEPGAGEVRVKVKAVGLNYSDILIREGRYMSDMPLPFVLGREFCGTIDKADPESEKWKIGQRVFGRNTEGGALAEYVVTRPILDALPDGLTFIQGPAIRVQGRTAMLVVDHVAKVQRGETVLIHAAAGGIGLLAVQIARARGAHVIGTASTDEKCQAIAELGGTPINYSKGDWVKEVLAYTDGKGAEVILESVGGDVLVRSYREALAIFGRLVVFGVASHETIQLTNRDILASNKALLGYWVTPYFDNHRHLIAGAIWDLVELVQQGKVKLTIGKIFPLEESREAFSYMQNRKNIGKVVIANQGSGGSLSWRVAADKRN